MTTAAAATTTTIEITPLMLACQNGNLDDVRSMLAKGVRTNILFLNFI